MQRLSDIQLRALKAAQHGLQRIRPGWDCNGSDPVYPTGTVLALASKGLVKINPLGGCMGTASITAAGRAELARRNGKGKRK